jgi:hypothetical protein
MKYQAPSFWSFPSFHLSGLSPSIFRLIGPVHRVGAGNDVKVEGEQCWRVEGWYDHTNYKVARFAEL